MPTFGHEDVTLAVANSSALVVLEGGARLAKVDAHGAYSWTAKLPADGEYFTLPDTVGDGVGAVWGAQVNHDLNGGTVDLRVSEDAGTTWR